MSNETQSNFEREKDKLAVKVKELVTKDAPIEDKQEASIPEQSSSEPELSEIEKQAYSLGWRPSGEYQGQNFVPAEEYVRRQPLFERIDRQGRELRELKTVNQQIAQHLASLRKEAYEQAEKDLEARRIQAINEGDSSQVFQAERQIRDIENKKANDPLFRQAEVSAQPPKLPEVESFESRNADWYNTSTAENRRMVEAASLADKQLAEQAAERGIVLDPKEHLRMVEESVKRNFAHRFPQSNPKKDAPPMVGISTSSKEGAKTGALVSRLTPEQRKTGEYFYRSNKEYTLEKYAEDLERMGRLNK